MGSIGVMNIAIEARLLEIRALLKDIECRKLETQWDITYPMIEVKANDLVPGWLETWGEEVYQVDLRDLPKLAPTKSSS